MRKRYSGRSNNSNADVDDDDGGEEKKDGWATAVGGLQVSPLQREDMHLARSPDNKLEAIQATCMSATPYRCLERRAAAGVQGQRQFRR